jgi:hypothetical protein
MKQIRTRLSGADSSHRQVVSLDGRLIFVLQRTRAGVHVQRNETVVENAHAGTVSLQMLFRTEVDFRRFCEADETRFKQPLTYQALTREFHDLLSLEL